MYLIDKILPEGIVFVGALSGVGKTWFSLSLVRALTTGSPFLGKWDVLNPVNVLYLCPEMSGKALRKRCERLAVNERFFCQTIDDGVPLKLRSPLLAGAIRELQPVVFLDTAIRFSNAESENSATDNQELSRDLFALMHAGAKAVVCLHHRSKDAARKEEMTLENVLRGTGDLGAIAEAVYGLRLDQSNRSSPQYLKESRRRVRLQVRCVKAREFVPVDDFRVELEPHINTNSDMRIVSEDDSGQSDADRVGAVISQNPTASLRRIAQFASVGKDRVKTLASQHGWRQEKSGSWKSMESST